MFLPEPDPSIIRAEIPLDDNLEPADESRRTVAALRLYSSSEPPLACYWSLEWYSPSLPTIKQWQKARKAAKRAWDAWKKEGLLLEGITPKAGRPRQGTVKRRYEFERLRKHLGDYGAIVQAARIQWTRGAPAKKWEDYTSGVQKDFLEGIVSERSLSSYSLPPGVKATVKDVETTLSLTLAKLIGHFWDTDVQRVAKELAAKVIRVRYPKVKDATLERERRR
jgi:hypothetical protein